MASYKLILALLLLGVAYASAQLVGAPREMSQAEIDKDKDLQAAMQFAVDKYNSVTDSRYKKHCSLDLASGKNY